jgi:hypothetical protein
MSPVYSVTSVADLYPDIWDLASRIWDLASGIWHPPVLPR